MNYEHGDKTEPQQYNARGLVSFLFIRDSFSDTFFSVTLCVDYRSTRNQLCDTTKHTTLLTVVLAQTIRKADLSLGREDSKG